MKDNVESLTKLGSGSGGDYGRYNNPTIELLEIFPNQYPHRLYTAEYATKEFTSLCPKTKQPDFATITISYIPNKFCIETKSLKLYLLAYRNEGAFMETITNKILEDCVAACAPKYMKVVGDFNARGGTTIKVTAEYHHAPLRD